MHSTNSPEILGFLQLLLPLPQPSNLTVLFNFYFLLLSPLLPLLGSTVAFLQDVHSPANHDGAVPDGHVPSDVVILGAAVNSQAHLADFRHIEELSL